MRKVGRVKNELLSKLFKPSIRKGRRFPWGLQVQAGELDQDLSAEGIEELETGDLDPSAANTGELTVDPQNPADLISAMFTYNDKVKVGVFYFAFHRLRL